ncbi:MAG: hypothetical protein RBG13Loki_1463 [Promethearchaeota archaeon CR_4]|nr:MAG: hypothetical protein RBG13Loki_1463 [Candidatus Lokiarchaeota archaeon CR_4]
MSETEIEYLRFYKRIISLLEKHNGKMDLKAIASELNLTSVELLQSLCKFVGFNAFELDGDILVLLPFRNVGPEIELGILESIRIPIEKAINERVNVRIQEQIKFSLEEPLHTVTTSLRQGIEEQLNETPNITLEDWDLEAIKARIYELRLFTRKMRFQLLTDYLKSVCRKIPDLIPFLNQHYNGLFELDNENVIFY